MIAARFRFVAVLATAVTAVLNTACTPTPTREPEVVLTVPVQRLDLPERPARVLSAGWDAGPTGTQVVLAGDQSVAAPGSQGATFEHGHAAGAVWVEAYPAEALGLGVAFRNSDGEGLPVEFSGRVKVHALQTGRYSLALTGAYGERTYDYLMNHVEHSGGFFDTGHLVSDAHTSIEARERDFAIVAGFRPLKGVLMYGGPFLYQQPYRGTHTDYDTGAAGSTAGGSTSGPGSGSGSGSGSDGGPLDDLIGGGGDDPGSDGGSTGGSTGNSDPQPITTAFADEVEMRGFNAGLAIDLGIPELRLIAEIASARIESGGRSDDTLGVNLAFRGAFGGRL